MCAVGVGAKLGKGENGSGRGCAAGLMANAKGEWAVGGRRDSPQWSAAVHCITRHSSPPTATRSGPPIPPTPHRKSIRCCMPSVLRISSTSARLAWEGVPARNRRPASNADTRRAPGIHPQAFLWLLMCDSGGLAAPRKQRRRGWRLAVNERARPTVHKCWRLLTEPAQEAGLGAALC